MAEVHFRSAPQLSQRPAQQVRVMDLLERAASVTDASLVWTVCFSLSKKDLKSPPDEVVSLSMKIRGCDATRCGDPA